MPKISNEKRTVNTLIRQTPSERKLLEELARHMNANLSDTIRWAIETLYVEEIEYPAYQEQEKKRAAAYEEYAMRAQTLYDLAEANGIPMSFDVNTLARMLQDSEDPTPPSEF